MVIDQAISSLLMSRPALAHNKLFTGTAGGSPLPPPQGAKTSKEAGRPIIMLALRARFGREARGPSEELVAGDADFIISCSASVSCIFIQPLREPDQECQQKPFVLCSRRS